MHRSLRASLITPDISANTIMGRVFSPAKKINALIPGIISDVKAESEAAMAKRDGRLTSDAQKNSLMI